MLGLCCPSVSVSDCWTINMSRVAPVCLQWGYFLFLPSWPKSCGAVLPLGLAFPLLKNFWFCVPLDLAQFLKERMHDFVYGTDLLGTGEMKAWVEWQETLSYSHEHWSRETACALVFFPLVEWALLFTLLNWQNKKHLCMIVRKLGSLEPHTGSAAAPWQEQAHSNATELWLLRDLFNMWNNLKPWKFYFCNLPQWLQTALSDPSCRKRGVVVLKELSSFLLSGNIWS